MTVGTHQQHSDWEWQLEQLSTYLDGELGESERTILERHLPTCEECRQALDELRHTRAQLRALPVPELPRSFLLPETGAVPFPMSRARSAALAAPGHSSTGVGRARALQWIGGLVAVLGFAILISTTLPAPHPATSAASSAAHAPAARSSASPAVLAGTPSHTATSASITSATIPVSSPAAVSTQAHASTSSSGTIARPNTPMAASTSSTMPAISLTGTALAVGGAVLLIAGTALARRRAQKPGADAQETTDS